MSESRRSCPASSSSSLRNTLNSAKRIKRSVGESYGPLERKAIELIKVGISVGAGLETATRSHVRQAMQHGASEGEIEQAVLLAYNTIGWPRMVAAWTWARQQIERDA